MSILAPTNAKASTQAQAQVRVPRCAAHNPNPRILIPWLPVGKGDWTLAGILAYAKERHLRYGYRCKPGTTELAYVHLHTDGIWWSFVHSLSCQEVVRRPRLKEFPSGCRTYPTDEGPKPIKGDYPSFFCEVCGRQRPEDEATPVQCGVDKWHSDEFLVCTQCIQKDALHYSRRMGYFVSMKPREE